MHLAVESVERSICSHHGSTMDAQLSNVLLVDLRRNIGEPGKTMTERNELQVLKSSPSIFARKISFYWFARRASNLSSSRKLWQDLNLLMRKSDDSHSPSLSDASQAESFSKYFVDKVGQIRRAIDDVPDPDYILHSGSSINAFKHITTKEVEDLITASPNNCCLLDPVPTSLVKNCASLLAPYVSHLFNRSLAEGYIPASQKIAVVKPQLKKRGLDIGDRKNFRPVSNLMFISKLLERIVCTHTTQGAPGVEQCFSRSSECILKVLLNGKCSS